MRKTLMMLGVGTFLVLTLANDANAQRYGGRGYGGPRSGISVQFGSGGYSPYYGGGYGGYRPNYGYGSFGYGNPYYYGPGYYGNRYGSGYGSGIGITLGSGGVYATPGYYSTPNVYSTPTVYTNPRPTYVIDRTLTPVSAVDQRAMVRVMVPSGEAKVWLQDKLMTTEGTERNFVSPPLEPGYDYQYTVKATWTDENGRTVERERKVNLQPGQTQIVDFNQT